MQGATRACDDNYPTIMATTSVMAMATASDYTTTTTIPIKDRKTARREWPEGIVCQGIGMKRVGTSYPMITKLLKVPNSTLTSAMARYQRTG